MNLDKELINKIKINPLLDTLKLENISDDEYFSEKFGGFISNSRLGLLKSKGVKAFFEGLAANNEYNPSFALGTNLHQLVLQPESYELIDSVFKPTAKAGLMSDALYKSDGTTPKDDEIKSQSYIIGYYKDKLTPSRLKEFKDKAEPYWRDRYVFEQKNPPQSDKERIYTDEKSYNILNECLKNLKDDNNIQKLLHPIGIIEDPICLNERTILLDIEAEIEGYDKKVFRLKAKLDNFVIDKEENKIIINDLKTSSYPIEKFDPLFYSYNREIASYSWLLKLCCNKFYNMNPSSIEGNFLVVSTIPEYTTRVFSMDSKMFKSGWAEYNYLLKTAIYYNIVKGYEFK